MICPQAEQYPKLNSQNLKQLFKLWNQEYPLEASFQQIEELEEYLAHLQSPVHYLFFSDTKELKAWFCVFERNGLPWFAMIVDRNKQGLGWGSEILKRAQEKYEILNGWAVDHNQYQKSDGSLYPSPLGFYEKLGFRKTKQRFDQGQLSVCHIIWP